MDGSVDETHEHGHKAALFTTAMTNDFLHVYSSSLALIFSI